MLSIAPPFLVISEPRTGKVYAEVVYTRPLIENSTWLHIITADSCDINLYKATYVTSSCSIKGIYSVFFCDGSGNKWLVKGLFERTDMHSPQSWVCK
jgi:hypothetical protein